MGDQSLSDKINFHEIESFIGDRKLAENALDHLKEKGGDLLLIKSITDDDSLFLKTIKEKSSYGAFFTENYNSLPLINDWSRFQQKLGINFMESTCQNSVIPSVEAEKLANRIVSRWKTESQTG